MGPESPGSPFCPINNKLPLKVGYHFHNKISIINYKISSAANTAKPLHIRTVRAVQSQNDCMGISIHSPMSNNSSI